jgi:hypothetical protein
MGVVDPNPEYLIVVLFEGEFCIQSVAGTRQYVPPVNLVQKFGVTNGGGHGLAVPLE